MAKSCKEQMVGSCNGSVHIHGVGFEEIALERICCFAQTCLFEQMAEIKR